MGKKEGNNHFKPLEVSPRSGEPAEKMIKRFMKKVRGEGILQELFLRRSYEKPSARIRRKRSMARFLRDSEEKS